MKMCAKQASVVSSVLVLAGLLAPSPARASGSESSVVVPSRPTFESTTAPTTSSTGNVSTADVSSGQAFDWVQDHFTAGIASTYHGASLNDPGSNFTLDHNGFRNTQNAIYFDTTSDVSYKFTSHSGIGAYIPFFAVPAPGQHFVIGDVGVQAYDKLLIDDTGIKVGANLILQSSSSDYSQARKQVMGIKTTPSISYTVPHTNWTLGSFTEGKSYLDVTSGKTFKLWALPYVRYALTDWLSLSMAYEMEADHFYGKPTWDFTSYQTDLQPGVVWWISKRIMFNPYVQIFTGTKVALDNMAMGAFFSARAF